MRRLGQVLTNGEKLDNDYMFNIITDIAEADNNQPLLIIGYERAKKLIKGFNPLKKEYDGNVFWTFGRRENRSQQEQDLKEFYRSTVNILTQCVDYVFVNTNLLSTERIKNLLRYFSADKNFYYFVSCDCHDKPSFIHVFDITAGKVFGFSISTITNFHNVKTETIYKWLAKHPNLKQKERNFTFSREVRKLIGGDIMTDLILWSLMFKCTNQEFANHKHC